MNKAFLMGRLTRDPELKTISNGQTSLCNFSIAIDRRFQKPGEEKQADFINCVAWRQQAEFVAKYFHKGSKILVIGSIQTRKYDDKEGRKVTATEVVVDEVEFVDSKSSSGGGGGYDAPPQKAEAPAKGAAGDGFFPAPDDDTSLPFDL
jgi:single-strand DNA-binding protein